MTGRIGVFTGFSWLEETLVAMPIELTCKQPRGVDIFCGRWQQNPSFSDYADKCITV